MQNKLHDSADKRIAYLDILRSIAIISITFNHAVNRSFAVNAGQLAEFQAIPFYLTGIKAVLYAFSRIGVPLFVMISGALLLPREYSGSIKEGSVSRFIRNNWLQLLLTTEIWLAIMFWYMQLSPDSALFSKGLPYALGRFVLTLLFLNPVTLGSMWYMEMILCVYLLIPILSAAVKQIDFKYFLLPMAMVVFCSFLLPDLNEIVRALGFRFSFETKLESANVFSMYVVYLLLGYYIGQGGLARIRASVLWIVLTAGAVGFCALQIWFYSVPFDLVVAQGYQSVFPMIISLALFELVRRYEPGKRKRLEAVSRELSGISFGIYFVHICIMTGLVELLKRFSPGITLMWKFLLLESVSFFGAVILVRVFSKNKLMKKYLFRIK